MYAFIKNSLVSNFTVSKVLNKLVKRNDTKTCRSIQQIQHHHYQIRKINKK